MSSLSEEQRRRMERNRQEALRKRAARNMACRTPSEFEDRLESGEKKMKVSDCNDQTIQFYGGQKDSAPTKSSYSTKDGKDITQSTSCSKAMPVTGHCKLVRRDRFSVDIGYHQGLLSIFKSIPSALYDPGTKKWNFQLTDHGRLLSAVASLKGELSISPLPKVILETFLRTSGVKNNSSSDDSRIDPVLFYALMPFQRDGIRFGISKNGRCLIADEMGLGKTIQALGIAHYYYQDWPLLIVCPSSVKYTWKEAIETWLPSIVRRQVDVLVINTSKEDLSLGKVVIMSVDMFTKSSDKLARFRCIIVDESHSLKNSKSARTQAAFKVLRKAKRVILLSGTPALSRPAELYPQLTCIDPVGFPRMIDFGIRYCNGKCKPWGWDFSGSSNTEELMLLLEERIMIRRLKTDVMGQLPAKTRELIILDPSAVNKKLTDLDKSLKNFQAKERISSERRGALLEYFNASGKAKLKAICNYIEDLLEDNVKFICFAHHQIVLNGICDVLCQNGIRYIRIDGSTPAGTRKELCDEYQLSDNCRVAVLSITAANTGLTLSAASLVIFAELFWNPGILAQAEDRAHRIGQKNNVVVRYLVAEGTADDHLWPMLQGKLEVLNSMGLSKENILDAECAVQKDSLQKEITSYFSNMSDEFDVQ